MRGDSVDTRSLSSEQFIKLIDYRQKQIEEFNESRLATQTFIDVCEMWFKGWFVHRKLLGFFTNLLINNYFCRHSSCGC